MSGKSCPRLEQAKRRRNAESKAIKETTLDMVREREESKMIPRFFFLLRSLNRWQKKKMTGKEITGEGAISIEGGKDDNSAHAYKVWKF